MNNKEIINQINFSENKTANKILKKVKLSNKIFYLLFFLETVSYILLIINLKRTSGVIIVSLLYLILTLDFSLTHKRHVNKVMRDTINYTICPEAYLNINLYYAKKIICPKNSYNYFLNNIAYSYILLGDLNKSEKILKYLDNQKKNLILQSQIIKNKIEIAFINNDLKKLNNLKDELNNIIRFLPGKIKKEIRIDLKIKQAVIDKKTYEVFSNCDLIEKNNILFNKIYSSYYRGLVQEKKGKQNYGEFYNFVAEHGNNLIIADKARKKINLKNYESKYYIKKYFVHKIFTILVFAILLSHTLFWSIFTIYRFCR